MVGLPILALIAGLVLLWTMAVREQSASAWVDHTIQVRQKLEAMLNDLLAAESNARGYAMTRESNLLPPFEQARLDAGIQLHQLQKLTRDNPGQQARIAPLRKLLDDKLAAMAALIEACRGIPVPLATPQLERARRAMEPLRAMLDEMNHEERQLLTLRQARLQAARSQSLLAGFGTLVLGVSGGIIATLLFGGSIARRMEQLRLNARALRLESPLLPLASARDEIGIAESELKLTSEIMARRSEKLRRSEAQLRAIIDHTTALVYVKDLEGRFILVNRQVEENLGRPAAQIIGKTSHDFYRQEIADEIAAHDREVLQLRQSRSFEEQVIHSGRELTLLSNKVPLLDDKGEPYALCGISTDITAQARAADQLHYDLEKESAQHQQTAATLKNTQAQLLQAQKMEIIGNIASGVAHDFNNILTAIMGYATLLRGDGNTDAQEYASEIMQAAERAASLSKQLLGFARLRPNEAKIISLEEVIRRVEGMLRRVIGDTISLRTTIERDVGAVRADPSQIEQLLLNLVVNARDAMPTGGRITIALRKTANASLNHNGDFADWVELSVADEGTGIPPEVQRRMFEPFFTTKRPGQGTGLGLATCATIAEQNNARLDFTTAPARGTTFTLRLPRIAEAAPVAAQPLEVSSVPGEGTLLVVEDEPAVGEIVALLLRDLGYEVLTADNGEAAERIISECEREIDLVLTDLNMPRMNGRELLARLTRNNPRVRVILTSGNEELLDDNTADLLPIEFLPKPFTRQSLAEKVQAALAK